MAKPSFGDAEMRAVQRPVESGWVAQGPQVQEFEQLFRDYVGAAHAVATTSCTTALHLAVTILGLKPGDEVLVPAFTWISTANVVEYTGATPRFCDIDLETFNIDPARIEELISPKTVGVIPVHLFGLCAAMGPILEVARTHGLWVVEDAACAFGARQGGSHAGSWGEIGAFSFHPRKSITTGEGGMLTTPNAEFAQLGRVLRDQGADQTGPLSGFNHLGFNYRMTDLQGALGCAQMDRADEILDERRRRAAIYDEELRAFDWLAPPTTPEDNVHGYQSYTCLFRPEEPRLENLDLLGERRNGVMAEMEDRGIATRPGTHAAALTPYYAGKYGTTRDQFPRSAIAERLSLALPLYPDMTDVEQELVLSELRRAYEAA